MDLRASSPLPSTGRGRGWGEETSAERFDLIAFRSSCGRASAPAAEGSSIGLEKLMTVQRLAAPQSDPGACVDRIDGDDGVGIGE